MHSFAPTRWLLTLLVLLAGAAGAQSTPVAPMDRDFVKIDAPLIALEHVRIIDGTGSPAKLDQSILIGGGRLQTVGDAANLAIPAGAARLDLRGYTVIPGLVGMHNHLFCITTHSGMPVVREVAISFSRLYLAHGVTTIRTTGSIEPYTDLNLKKLIDERKIPGPKMFVTAPYLEGAYQGRGYFQNHQLSGPNEAKKMVEFWADQGATSFKVYVHITRAELRATVEAAHRRGLKVTGHLCSIGYREAVALGIDNIEHGFMEDSEFVPTKQPDVCPDRAEELARITAVEVDSAPVKELFRDLIQHHVAITSTLPIFEANLVQRPLPRRALEVMLPEWRASMLTAVATAAGRTPPPSDALLKKNMQLERAFVRAGGLLLAGSDAVGLGGVLAGFADLREIEMLVEAGFTVEEAIQIASANGAKFLGVLDRIGTISAGKQADLAVIHGDPTAKITDVEKVELVFKDGIGYDSAKLIESVRGIVGFQ
jgi:imidazolonepropionase-like amidohydrolase